MTELQSIEQCSPSLAKLSPKRAEFAKAYAKGCDGATAYVAAGYKVKNRATARANASRLLTDANVSAAVDELRALGVEEFRLQKEHWLHRMLEIAESTDDPSERLVAMKSIADVAGWRQTKPAPVVNQVVIAVEKRSAHVL